MTDQRPGLIVLFGSGETSPSGGRVMEAVARRLGARPRIAVLETPAGFEPNASQVAGRVGDFLGRRLQNYNPEISLVPARRRGTPFSPDNAVLLQPILRANWIFLGPGSPTYAARQLQGSLAWQMLLARHRLGATLVLASAAVIAAGTYVLPVYEIYKAGDDLHWRAGLDLFAAYGLPLTLMPHWNNSEGGADLDTRYCYMGQERFTRLAAQLPPAVPVVGIDEHTALVVDVEAGQAQVMGLGSASLRRRGRETVFASGQSFDLRQLGDFRPAAQPEASIPPAVWQAALEAEAAMSAEGDAPAVPAEVEALVQERQAARQARDWSRADELRQRIAALGWNVKDTPQGPQLEPLSKS